MSRTLLGLEKREYTAKLSNGKRLKLSIHYNEQYNYCTCHIKNSNLEWYDQVTGTFADAVEWIATSTDIVAWNNGNPVEWQEVNHG